MQGRPAPPGERIGGRGSRWAAPSSMGEEEPQTKVPSPRSPAYQPLSPRSVPTVVAFEDVDLEGHRRHNEDKAL